MDDIAAIFDDLKMTEFSSSTRNRSACVAAAKDKMARLGGVREGGKYNVQVIKRAGQHDTVFRRRVRLYRELARCDAGLVPKVFDVTQCGQYGLVVTDGWDGLLSQLLRRKPEWRSNWPSIHAKVQDMVRRLHGCGYTLGKCSLSTFEYRIRGGSLQLAIKDTNRLRKTVAEQHRQSDYRQVELLGHEINVSL